MNGMPHVHRDGKTETSAQRKLIRRIALRAGTIEHDHDATTNHESLARTAVRFASWFIARQARDEEAHHEADSSVMRCNGCSTCVHHCPAFMVSKARAKPSPASNHEGFARAGVRSASWFD
jgi:hypothetical protein